MLSNNGIRKNKIEALSTSIANHLSEVNIDNLIVELFVRSENPYTWELIKKFEGIILDIKLNPGEAVENVYNFLESTTEFITKNKLEREFLDFYYLVYTNQYVKKTNPYIFSAYLSIIFEQANWLCPEDRKLVGMKTDGTLITIEDVYPNVETATVEFYKKITSKKANINDFKVLNQIYKKYGYNVNTPDDLNKLSNNEQTVSHEFTSLMSIIDENLLDMLPIPYHEPFSNYFIPIRKWFDTSKYIEHLSSRTYILPHKGVLCRFKNAGGIREITFKEKLLDDKIIMVYKAKMQDSKYISGYYDTALEFFNDVWKNSGAWQNKINTMERSKTLENFILEVYAHLTTDMKVERKKNSGILIVDDIENPGFYFQNQPVMQVFKLNSNNRVDGGKDVVIKPYNKSEYIQAKKFIQPLIRKLPTGAKASDEAKSLARSMGYELKDGETFVRQFTKNVNIKKD